MGNKRKRNMKKEIKRVGERRNTITGRKIKGETTRTSNKRRWAEEKLRKKKTGENKRIRKEGRETKGGIVDENRGK